MEDYIKFTQDEDQGNLFKGRVLTRFLVLESNIENIITSFFYNEEIKDIDFFAFS
ncbi:MAG: hypothetical protein IPK08_05950 [Bacteroidetes bacterium]|nr:hypothetical protein [Bacteroidota bacterium]